MYLSYKMAQTSRDFFLTMRNNLQMTDLLTLMFSIGKWRSVNVCVTHREARQQLPTERGYKYTAMLLSKLYVLGSMQT